MGRDLMDSAKIIRKVLELDGYLKDLKPIADLTFGLYGLLCGFEVFRSYAPTGQAPKAVIP